MRRALVLLLALAAGTGRAGAQARQVELPPRLQPATRATIERLADSARVVGLPWEPLYSKAEEGVLKGADDARIVVAVRTLVRRLAESRDALAPAPSEAEVVAGASALHAGVPASTLRSLRKSQPPPLSLAMPLVVMADLITRGVPADTAAVSVEALMQRRATDSEYRALREGVGRRKP